MKNRATIKAKSRYEVGLEKLESAANQVDPVLLASRLSNIGNVSNFLLSKTNSGLNSVESPPYVQPRSNSPVFPI